MTIDAAKHGARKGISLHHEIAHWRTPNATMADHGPMSPAYREERGQMVTLDDQATHWMTPNVPNGGRTASHAIAKGRTLTREDGTKVQLGLEHQAKTWPTPMSRDHRSGHAQKTDEELWGKKGRPLERVATTFRPSLPDQPTADGHLSSPQRRRLNPLFVEWLMGWPEGLSGFDTAAMGSCHSPQPSHGCGCMDCWLTQQRAMLSDLLTIDPPAQGLLL
ncbi:hypothetical protein ASE70_14975 [Sphingomonas sp. Leaf22]|uniref:hypothetical protein n=1 Tax=Sphingomonas sp. Leaf22 TaxID=1735687 RepID=UPI0006F86D04|nr:hypothetical protein [Sphingomonas sp. Leaf22]KQM92215.1 hypothetical protein ASE70_14975 [Sphingomonas sp. Leaf22]